MNSDPIPEILTPETKQATHWLMALAIVLILTGAVAIAVPGISSVAFTLILGWLLLFNGIVRLIKSFQSRPIRGFWLNLIIGVLYVIAGLYVVFNPVDATVTLTWLFGFLLIVEGVITLAATFVNQYGSNLSWLVALDGIITLILGILLLNQWPFSAVWLLGLYIGISILMSGVAVLAIALSTRRAISQAEDTAG